MNNLIGENPLKTFSPTLDAKMFWRNLTQAYLAAYIKHNPENAHYVYIIFFVTLLLTYYGIKYLTFVNFSQKKILRFWGEVERALQG